MQKKNVAVFFGGRSSEYGVSLQSAYSVICNINKDKYDVIPVGITQEGEFFIYMGDIRLIPDDKWIKDNEHLQPCTIVSSCSSHGIMAFKNDTYSIIHIDIALPILHGQNGEDGTIQGALEIAGIPVAGCNTMASALCMDKGRAHKIVEIEGVRTPKDVTLTSYNRQKVMNDIAKLGFPVFVKPVRAGSSYGISKVSNADSLDAAIDFAMQYDGEVIVEEYIRGREVGCAVLGKDELVTGRVDEIELNGDFFDFAAKYDGKEAEIHMPARIDEQTEKCIRDIAKRIYRALGCSGFARVDLFLTDENEVVFNEVNTIPGFTSHSRYPSMMKGIGLSLAEVLDKILALYD